MNNNQKLHCTMLLGVERFHILKIKNLQKISNFSLVIYQGFVDHTRPNVFVLFSLIVSAEGMTVRIMYLRPKSQAYFSTCFLGAKSIILLALSFRRGSLGCMQFRISTIFLLCFRKSVDRNWLFPLFITVMSKVFLLHVKHNINQFLSILHVTDQTQAVAVVMGDYFARKILSLLLLLWPLSSDICDMYCFRLS